jgi:hypothetical protein
MLTRAVARHSIKIPRVAPPPALATEKRTSRRTPTAPLRVPFACSEVGGASGEPPKKVKRLLAGASTAAAPSSAGDEAHRTSSRERSAPFGGLDFAEGSDEEDEALSNEADGAPSTGPSQSKNRKRRRRGGGGVSSASASASAGEGAPKVNAPPRRQAPPSAPTLQSFRTHGNGTFGMT